MKNVDEISVLGQFLLQAEILIFRVAIYKKIGYLFYLMGTLIKKGTSNSSFLRVKIHKSDIYFSGFQKKHARVAIAQKVHVRIL